MISTAYNIIIIGIDRLTLPPPSGQPPPPVSVNLQKTNDNEDRFGDWTTGGGGMLLIYGTLLVTPATKRPSNDPRRGVDRLLKGIMSKNGSNAGSELHANQIEEENVLQLINWQAKSANIWLQIPNQVIPMVNDIEREPFPTNQFLCN